MIAPWQEIYDKPRQCLKKQRHHFADRGLYSQGYGLYSSHVQMWEWDHKGGRAPKHWCFLSVVLEKTLESPLDNKEIKSANLKENQPWILIGRNDAEAEALIFWSPDTNSQLIGKDSDAGKDWRQKEKRATENEMVGWHHWFNGLGQTPRDGYRTWKPGVLQSIGSQRVRHNLATEHQQHIQNS